MRWRINSNLSALIGILSAVLRSLSRPAITEPSTTMINNHMYIWLLIIVVLGSVIAGLLRLRNTADKMPISADKLELMRQRNAELEAQERQQDE